MYRIEIDRSLCSAYGTCIDVAPDLFELSDDLIAVARVGETDAEAAVEAASACPMGAIRLVEIRADARGEPRTLAMTTRIASECGALDPSEVSQPHLIGSVDGLGQAPARRREHWQWAADRGGGGRIAGVARDRRSNLAPNPSAPDCPCIRRDAADPRRLTEVREHGMAHAPLLPAVRGVRPSWPAAAHVAHGRRAGAHRSRRSFSLRRVPRFSSSARPKGLSSACTRRASSSGSGRLPSTCWRMSRSCRASCGHGLRELVLRLALVVGAVAAGLLLAVATLPAADQLQDRASAHVRLDAD